MLNKYQILLMVGILLVVGLVVYQAAIERTKESGNRIESFSAPEDKIPINKVDICDDFQDGSLSEKRWILTKQNDFRQRTIDVIDVGRGDFRLRLSADTISTGDDTVKYHGIRSVKYINLVEGKAVSFDLDWNNQANGCYLTAGIYLCPTSTDANPRDEPDWLALEYVGVPPGKTARFQVVRRIKGNLRFLFTEGCQTNSAPAGR